MPSTEPSFRLPEFEEESGESLESCGSVKRVWWITNYAAPYRLPVWDHIAKQASLSVMLLENQAKSSLPSQNRGTDWNRNSQSEAQFTVQEWPTWCWVRGETVLYVALGLLKKLNRPDVILPDTVLLGGWESPAYWQMLLLAKLRGWRAVGFYESTVRSNRFKNGPIAWARAVFFRSLDAVVVPGVAARTAVERMGVSPEKIYEGFNAVDVSEVHRRTSELREIDSRYPAEERPYGHRFLFVGQLIERKNVKGLLRAFALMADPTDTLTIVGQGSREAELRACVTDLGLDGQVTFLGQIPYSDVPQLFSRHETLVLPSHDEVWGLVVNEALAGGLHCVVTESSGVADSVRGMRGVYITEKSEPAIGLGMKESRAHWDGPATSPEILAFTPQRFAEVFLSAFGAKTA